MTRVKHFLLVGLERIAPNKKITSARKEDLCDGTTSSPSIRFVKYNEQKIKLAVVKILILDELPFRFVEC